MKPTLENADYFLGVLAASHKGAEIVLDFNTIINEARALIARLEHDLANVCRHQNCEMVSGRKRDYLYCSDCQTNLESDGS